MGILNYTTAQLNALLSDISGKQATIAKNTPNGYAGLDSEGKLIRNQFPHYVSIQALLADKTASTLPVGSHVVLSPDNTYTLVVQYDGAGLEAIGTYTSVGAISAQQTAGLLQKGMYRVGADLYIFDGINLSTAGISGSNIHWDNAVGNLIMGDRVSAHPTGVRTTYYAKGTNTPSGMLLANSDYSEAAYGGILSWIGSGMFFSGALSLFYGTDQTSRTYLPNIEVSKFPGDDIQINIGSRFSIGVDGSMESGANTGSDFYIARYDDLGILIDKPLSINRSTGVVTAPSLSNTQAITLTGDVTGTGTNTFATTIAGGSVTNAKLANMAATSLKGNNTGVPAAVTDLSATQVTAMLNSFTSTLSGVVPASGGGTANYLRADGTWAAPPGGGGSGTVTTVSVVTANGVSGTVATASTTPALTINLGAITPTSVTAAGAVSGSNLSGTNTGDETALTIRSKLGITTLSGSNTGDQTITLTGDISGTGTGSFAASIATGVVSNAKLANMAATSLKGNNGGASLPPTDLSATQVTAMLNNFTSTLKGLTPASGGGTTNFLRADGTWAAPPAGGGGTSYLKVLASGGAPFILAGAGTMGNNGAFTQTTGITGATGLESWVWFNTGALYAASPAGWYWGVWGSSTSCTVYADTYTSGVPTNPAAPIALVTTGPGAYAGAPASTPITAFSLAIAGADLTPYCSVECDMMAVGAATSNKVAMVTFNGINAGGLVIGPTYGIFRQAVQFRGSLSKWTLLDRKQNVMISPVHQNNNFSTGFTLATTLSMPAGASNEWFMLGSYQAIILKQ